MFLGLFRKKVKLVTVKKKAKAKKRVKPRIKKSIKKTKIKRKVAKKPLARTKVKKKVVKLKVVGKITHYFPHVKAGVILVTSGKIALGDRLQIKGHTTDFKQVVASMQIDNAPIKEAKTGDEVGLLMKSRVRHNDLVYKL